MSYLEQCVRSVQSIDPGELGAIPLGEAVSWQGESYRTYTLGRLLVAGEPTHVGLKKPRINTYDGGASINRRVLTDVSLITLLADTVPELLPMAPQFLGVLSVKGNGGVAVLTEDASAGKTHEVEYQTPLPDDVEQALFSAFAWAGERDEVFNLRDMRRSMAFDVDGNVRILDLTPGPFQFHINFRKWPEYGAIHDAAYDQLDALTVTVGRDSALAQSTAIR